MPMGKPKRKTQKKGALTMEHVRPRKPRKVIEQRIHQVPRCRCIGLGFENARRAIRKVPLPYSQRLQVSISVIVVALAHDIAHVSPHHLSPTRHPLDPDQWLLVPQAFLLRVFTLLACRKTVIADNAPAATRITAFSRHLVVFVQ